MAATVQFRPHNRDLGVVVREVDEDLAIFLGMKNGAEAKPNGLGEEAFHILAYDSLLNSENGKSDHDWLLAQHDADEQHLAVNRANDSISECISLSPEQLPKSSISISSTAAPVKRPLSSNGQKQSSRASTPSRRPSLPSKTKPRASTPTSRAPSRAPAKASSKPVASQARSSTPTSRSTTPAPTSKPVTRSSTPSRSSNPSARNASSSSKSTTSSASTNMSTSSGNSSGRRTNPVPVAIKSTFRDAQTVKSRPSKPLEMLSLSQNAPQSVKASMPKRPSSASRGRPNALTKVKPRQKSCSPPKARAKSGSTTLSRNRGFHGGGDDDVNPVLMGTQMVERVVNMRKLAPPKQDEHASVDNPKKSSLENSGFGRSLSKKSLDMAMRHMDIRRSIAGSLKPVATSVLAHFSNGNQSSSSQNSSFGVSESPITSSSDSSKSSNCVSSYFLDGRD